MDPNAELEDGLGVRNKVFGKSWTSDPKKIKKKNLNTIGFELSHDFSIDLKLAKMISNFVFLVSIKYRNGIFATKFAKFEHVTQGGK